MKDIRNPVSEALINTILKNERPGVRPDEISNAVKTVYNGVVNINYNLNGGRYQHEVLFEEYVEEFTKCVKDILEEEV